VSRFRHDRASVDPPLLQRLEKREPAPEQEDKSLGIHKYPLYKYGSKKKKTLHAATLKPITRNMTPAGAQ